MMKLDELDLKSFLRDQHLNFLDNLLPDDIFDILYSLSCLSLDEIDEIKSEKSRRSKVSRFLRIIGYKDCEKIAIFIKSLQETQEFLFKSLVFALNNDKYRFDSEKFGITHNFLNDVYIFNDYYYKIDSQKDIIESVVNLSKSDHLALWYLITGPGGVGKSQTLCNVLRTPEISSRFDSIIWIDCYSQRCSKAIMNLIYHNVSSKIDVLRHTVQIDIDKTVMVKSDSLDTLCTQLAFLFKSFSSHLQQFKPTKINGSPILVLDNLDHASVVKFLTRIPVKCIVTSRIANLHKYLHKSIVSIMKPLNYSNSLKLIDRLSQEHGLDIKKVSIKSKIYKNSHGYPFAIACLIKYPDNSTVLDKDTLDSCKLIGQSYPYENIPSLVESCLKGLSDKAYQCYYSLQIARNNSQLSPDIIELFFLSAEESCDPNRQHFRKEIEEMANSNLLILCSSFDNCNPHYLVNCLPFLIKSDYPPNAHERFCNNAISKFKREATNIINNRKMLINYGYIWKNLTYHLVKAELHRDLIQIWSNIFFLTAMIQHFGLSKTVRQLYSLKKYFELEDCVEAWQQFIHFLQCFAHEAFEIVREDFNTTHYRVDEAIRNSQNATRRWSVDIVEDLSKNKNDPSNFTHQSTGRQSKLWQARSNTKSTHDDVTKPKIVGEEKFHDSFQLIRGMDLAQLAFCHPKESFIFQSALGTIRDLENTRKDTHRQYWFWSNSQLNSSQLIWAIHIGSKETTSFSLNTKVIDKILNPENHYDRPTLLSESSQLRYILIGANDGRISLINTETGTIVNTSQTFNGYRKHSSHAITSIAQVHYNFTCLSSSASGELMIHRLSIKDEETSMKPSPSSHLGDDRRGLYELCVDTSQLGLMSPENASYASSYHTPNSGLGQMNANYVLSSPPLDVDSIADVEDVPSDLENEKTASQDNPFLKNDHFTDNDEENFERDIFMREISRISIINGIPVAKDDHNLENDVAKSSWQFINTSLRDFGKYVLSSWEEIIHPVVVVNGHHNIIPDNCRSPMPDDLLFSTSNTSEELIHQSHHIANNIEKHAESDPITHKTHILLFLVNLDQENLSCETMSSPSGVSLFLSKEIHLPNFILREHVYRANLDEEESLIEVHLTNSSIWIFSLEKVQWTHCIDIKRIFQTYKDESPMCALSKEQSLFEVSGFFPSNLVQGIDVESSRFFYAAHQNHILFWNVNLDCEELDDALLLNDNDKVEELLSKQSTTKHWISFDNRRFGDATCINTKIIDQLPILAMGTLRGHVLTWELLNRTRLFSFSAHSGPINYLSIIPPLIEDLNQFYSRKMTDPNASFNSILDDEPVDGLDFELSEGLPLGLITASTNGILKRWQLENSVLLSTTLNAFQGSVKTLNLNNNNPKITITNSHINEDSYSLFSHRSYKEDIWNNNHVSQEPSNRNYNVERIFRQWLGKFSAAFEQNTNDLLVVGLVNNSNDIQILYRNEENYLNQDHKAHGVKELFAKCLISPSLLDVSKSTTSQVIGAVPNVLKKYTDQLRNRRKTEYLAPRKYSRNHSIEDIQSRTRYLSIQTVSPDCDLSMTRASLLQRHSFNFLNESQLCLLDAMQKVSGESLHDQQHSSSSSATPETTCLQVSPNLKHVAVGFASGHVLVYRMDISPPRNLCPIKIAQLFRVDCDENCGSVKRIIFVENEFQLLILHESRKIQFWRIPEEASEKMSIIKKPVRVWSLRGTEGNSLAVLPDIYTLLVRCLRSHRCDESKPTKLFIKRQLATKKEEKSMIHEGKTVPVWFCSYGDHQIHAKEITDNDNSKLCCWSMTSIEAHSKDSIINCLDIDPTQMFIASGASDGLIKIHCIQTGLCVFKSLAYRGVHSVYSVAFSPLVHRPSSKWPQIHLAAGFSDGCLRLWQLGPIELSANSQQDVHPRFQISRQNSFRMPSMSPIRFEDIGQSTSTKKTCLPEQMMSKAQHHNRVSSPEPFICYDRNRSFRKTQSPPTLAGPNPTNNKETTRDCLFYSSAPGVNNCPLRDLHWSQDASGLFGISDRICFWPFYRGHTEDTPKLGSCRVIKILSGHQVNDFSTQKLVINTKTPASVISVDVDSNNLYLFEPISNLFSS